MKDKFWPIYLKVHPGRESSPKELFNNKAGIPTLDISGSFAPVIGQRPRKTD